VTQPPEPTVIEWGSQPRGRLSQLASWQHPRLSWTLAGLGAMAMFGSLIGEWQVVRDPAAIGLDVEEGREVITLGIGLTLVWGPAWLIGAMLLAVCGGLALAGQPSIRSYARTVGLVVAVVELGVLAAAAVSLSREQLFTIGNQDIELGLGRGVYAAFASVLLLGAALYLIRTIQPVTPPAPPPQRGGSDPEDLVVGPAEPLVQPADDHPWR
jgi:hypothetical protein